jgi:hypothetical protein
MSTASLELPIKTMPQPWRWGVESSCWARPLRAPRKAPWLKTRLKALPREAVYFSRRVRIRE